MLFKADVWDLYAWSSSCHSRTTMGDLTDAEDGPEERWEEPRPLTSPRASRPARDHKLPYCFQLRKDCPNGCHYWLSFFVHLLCAIIISQWYHLSITLCILNYKMYNTYILVLVPTFFYLVFHAISSTTFRTLAFNHLSKQNRKESTLPKPCWIPNKTRPVSVSLYLPPKISDSFIGFN